MVEFYSSYSNKYTVKKKKSKANKFESKYTTSYSKCSKDKTKEKDLSKKSYGYMQK